MGRELADGGGRFGLEEDSCLGAMAMGGFDCILLMDALDFKLSSAMILPVLGKVAERKTLMMRKNPSGALTLLASAR